ncbi:MAG TPA: ATP-binding cassette domain-containing protein [Solirubrobacterales bacterium]|nr:ATP-binding cassette domain-containing protein [Solirubrobacterales bacterium]
MPSPGPLLQARELRVCFGGGRDIFGQKKTPFEALKGIDFEVAAGEAYAIVGESGAGKSTAARCVVGLQRPTSGEILFDGEPLSFKGPNRRAIQMVFQDPYSSLNPRMSVGAALVELLRVNKIAASKQAARERAKELLDMVGMPASALELRPRAFSGGQRQRIGIARALAIEPTLLVADEPVSALDVSIQASILLLLKRLQQELGLTMLFISHDLAVVRQLCDRVAVMCEGEIIEEGTVSEVLSRPRQEFTRALLEAATDLPELEMDLAVGSA